jgi:hypothetical protein
MKASNSSIKAFPGILSLDLVRNSQVRGSKSHGHQACTPNFFTRLMICGWFSSQWKLEQRLRSTMPTGASPSMLWKVRCASMCRHRNTIYMRGRFSSLHPASSMTLRHAQTVRFCSQFHGPAAKS